MNVKHVKRITAISLLIALWAVSAYGQLATREFLVRLEDKTNTQVFCLSSVHKGEHMDRVVFDDPTFEAACPVCHSTEWLYRKNNAVSKKGHFITFKPAGWSWGTNERAHYGIVRITCTLEQAKVWCATLDDEQAKADVITNAADKASLTIAENLVTIGHRHRKLVFDFEKDLTINELAKWNDDKTPCDIIEKSVITMKEVSP